MKQHIFSAVAAVLIFATAVMATTQSSPYTINAGRIVSGGTTASDTAAMSKTDIVIG